jgi:radical SAM-linked protein
MRVMLRFSKGGSARYISHLDLMRTMNRAIRRAGLPVQYSQGFHPHASLSFAQALGLGYLSTGEYMEIGLEDTALPGDVAYVLNRALPEGISITGAWRLHSEFPTLMAAVSAARWCVEFDGPADEALLEKFKSLFDRDIVMAVKEGRNGPSNLDIRPGLYSIEKDQDKLELFLAAGSKLNIRPELVVKAALGSTANSKSVTRIELFTLVNGRHTPLFEICSDGDY